MFDGLSKLSNLVPDVPGFKDEADGVKLTINSTSFDCFAIWKEQGDVPRDVRRDKYGFALTEEGGLHNTVNLNLSASNQVKWRFLEWQHWIYSTQCLLWTGCRWAGSMYANEEEYEMYVQDAMQEEKWGERMKQKEPLAMDEELDALVRTSSLSK